MMDRGPKKSDHGVLTKTQEMLMGLYDVHLEERVEDFMCDAETARDAVGSDVERGEVLLVREDSDGLAVGLYVDAHAVSQLDREEDGWLDERAFSARCLVTEGVSHFVYLLLRAKDQEAVTQLELELQAEVDKWASGLLGGMGMALIAGRDAWVARSKTLREKLFRDVEYLDDEGTDAGDRYRVATTLAHRYVERLERTHLYAGDFEGLSRELRRFYRRGRCEKFEVAGRR